MRNITKYIRLSAIALSVFLTGTACSDDDAAGLNKYPEPVITEFYPSEGLPTSVVTIKGSNFGSERTERIGRVYFGGVEAREYVSWTDNEIQVRVPDGGNTGNITLWVWKNHTESATDFTCVPGAEITGINPNPTYPGASIEINGRNFQYFLDKGLTAADVSVVFTTEDGTESVAADELTSSTVKVKVPTVAKGGNIKVKFGDLQTIDGPELMLIGDMYIDAADYYAIKDVNGAGNMVDAESGSIANTKNGSYLIYKITAPATGLFDVNMRVGTTKNGSSLNVNIGNSPAIETAALNDKLTQVFKNTGSWTPTHIQTWGAFYMKEGETYYLKITFIQEGGTWVGNADEIKLTLSANQNQTPVNGQGGSSDGYVLYQNDFSGSSYYPFTDAWAISPCYIKTVDGALEYYYNAAALKEDNRRERRGCEVTCNFSTATEGWYGFKFYLPEGKFPMDESGIIIAQIFNQGCRNTWAGHLSIDKGVLKMSHRNALVDPVVGTVGTLETNKWYSVVMHFKAGRNNKGHIQVWLDNADENSPTYDSGNCNFAFGHWIDDETLDSTGNNPDCAGYNGGYDKLGCKFGLYVSNDKDITIRMDDLKALEGNPAGSFNIVKP